MNPMPSTTPQPRLDVSADLARLDEISSELEAIEAALGRLDEPSYGMCEQCGSPIGTELLIADPMATRCSVHAS
jgi:RNA polymerase-binding transcription factor